MSFRCLTFSILLVGVFFFGAESEVSAKDKAAKRVVHFSAITLYHPIMIYQRYQPLMNYLTKNTPYRFELKLSQDYRDIINFLKSNKVQVVLRDILETTILSLKLVPPCFQVYNN